MECAPCWASKHFAGDEQWALLRRTDLPLTQCARAVVALVNRAIGNQPLQSRMDEKAGFEDELGAAQEFVSTPTSTPSLCALPVCELGTPEELHCDATVLPRQTPVLAKGAAVETSPSSDGSRYRSSEPVTCPTPDLAMAAPRSFGTPHLTALGHQKPAKCELDKDMQLRLREEFLARLTALDAKVEQLQAAELQDKEADYTSGTQACKKTAAAKLRRSVSVVTAPPSTDRSSLSD